MPEAQHSAARNILHAKPAQVCRDAFARVDHVPRDPTAVQSTDGDPVPAGVHTRRITGLQITAKQRSRDDRAAPGHREHPVNRQKAVRWCGTVRGIGQQRLKG